MDLQLEGDELERMIKIALISFRFKKFVIVFRAVG